MMMKVVQLMQIMHRKSGDEGDLMNNLRLSPRYFRRLQLKANDNHNEDNGYLCFR